MIKIKIVIVICVFSITTGIKGQVILDSTIYKCHVQKSYIDEILNSFMEENLMQFAPYQLMEKPNTIKQTIRFLNSDFETTVFSQFNFIKSSNFQAIYNGKTLHLGITEIGFDSLEDLEIVKNVIKSTKRTNFKLKVLTKFILLNKGNNLILVFSETPYDGLVLSFFDQIKDY